MPKTERRTHNIEFRVSQDGETPKIGGYAAVFNSSSFDMGWTEEIAPDAFDSVLKSKDTDVRCLWNHNDDHVLGRQSAGTLGLTVDSKGLAYEVTPPDTQFARDLMVSMRRKDITGSSFGFIVKRDQWTDNSDGSVTRRILEFDMLLDVSPVTFPAYPDATSKVRSLPESMPTEYRSRFEKRANVAGCLCGCSQCLADTCNLCSAGDCDDEVCSCYQQRSINESERHKMAMRLALLTIGQ